MKTEIYNAAYLINVIFQAFFNLMFPMAIMFFIGWLAVSRLSIGQWVYAVLLIFGLIIGLISMIKFLIYALDAFEKIEKAQKAKSNADAKENDGNE